MRYIDCTMTQVQLRQLTIKQYVHFWNLFNDVSLSVLKDK